jgi:HEAT repeat protein
MRRVIVALMVGFGSATVLAASPSVPDLVKKLDPKNARQTLAATRELAEYGPLAAPAVPALTSLLQSKDLAVQHEAVVALGRIGPAASPAVEPLTALLAGESLILKHSAIHALRMIGDDAKPALAKIRPLLKHDDTLLSVAAAWALVGIDPENKADINPALKVLTAALSDKSADVRNDAVLALTEIGAPAVAGVEAVAKKGSVEAVGACDVLAAIGPDAKAAVPTLVTLLKSEGPMVAWHAARALGEIGASPDIVIPALQKGLTSEVPENRAVSAVAIGSFGANAKASVEAIGALWKDKDPNVRIAACRALGEIGPAAASAVPQLNKVLDDDVGAVTLAAADALGQVGEGAVPVLAARLQDKDLRQLAASILTTLGPKAKGAVDSLVPLLGSDDLATRREALVALAAIGPDAKAAAPMLRERLKTADDRGRAGAAYALVKILGKGALPDLRAALEVKDSPHLHLASAWGLVTLEPENADHVKAAVPLLTAGLTAEHPVARKECAAALGRIGAPAAGSVDALLKATADPEAAVRAEAIGALGEINPTAKGVLERAVELLGDEISDVRLGAAYALGRIGPAAKAGVPGLKQLARSRTPAEHGVALWSLVLIAPGKDVVDQAVPVFIKALKNPKPEWRIEAARSLGDIGGTRVEVRKALMDASKDEDKKVQEAVTAALKRLGT